MEEKKNNALEKVENIIEEKEIDENERTEAGLNEDFVAPIAPFAINPVLGVDGMNGVGGINGIDGVNTVGAVPVFGEEEIAVENNRMTSAEADRVCAERRAEKQAVLEKKEERLKEEQIKAERERIRAERRVELARIKAQKRAEKEKAQANVKREKERRKAELKKRKLEGEERRKERRDRDRQKSKDGRRGTGGWLAAVISLGVATLVLSSVLTFTLLMPTETDHALEATYQKSFYDTVEQVDNIDLNLSKVLATNDTEAMQKYLVDTAINSELAENDLQQLPLQDESKYYTTKLINQIGDFSKYLNNKIISGEKLSESDMESLTRLYKANRTFKESLQRMVSEMGVDYSFSTMMDGGEGNLVIKNFNELQNLSVEYPELIYDGPFSDGQTNREIKGLTGEEITKERANDIFVKIFSRMGMDKVENVGETTSEIACYNIQTMVKGDNLYAQISKRGGKLIMFEYAGECKEVNHDRATAIETAESFLQTLEIEDMKPVWVNLANNVYTINFAYEQQGVIVYSDLIKIRICADTNTVLGYEATGYYTNHVERVIGNPTLSEAAAKEKVSTNIDIETARLALVPIGKSSEKLCYEFSGEYDGSTYYVYIDAVSGKQVEMFKVIESTEGELLM